MWFRVQVAHPIPIELNTMYYVKQMCPLLCPLLCPIGHIFCCALLYMGHPQTFNLFELLWQSEGLNPKPIELNLVLFILAKIRCKNKCALLYALFCALKGTYFVVPSLFYLFNKCALLCVLFCALQGTYFVVPTFI